jgi:hypothetical protein
LVCQGLQALAVLAGRAGVLRQSEDQSAGGFGLAAAGQEQGKFETGLGVLGHEHEHALKQQLGLVQPAGRQGLAGFFIGLQSLLLGLQGRAGQRSTAQPAQQSAHQGTHKNRDPHTGLQPPHGSTRHTV